jgi:hypothetical protein
MLYWSFTNPTPGNTYMRDTSDPGVTGRPLSTVSARARAWER